MNTLNMESLNSDTADQQLLIGQQALERAFQQVLEQFKHQNGVTHERRPIDRRNREFRDNVSSCCCSSSRNNTDEIPTFSLDFSNAPSCNVRGCNAKTAGRNKRILQIHLPESSRDPCQVLITSNRDQVTVKYLEQGQQFTFTSSNSSDETVIETPSRDNINDESTRAEAVSFSSSVGRGSQETPAKRKGDDLVNGDTPENLHDNSFLSSLTTDQLNESNAELPAAKKHKKQSLNTFIDSLLNKRTIEEGRKSLDSTNMSSDSETDHGRSFGIQLEDANTSSEPIETPCFVSESTSELTSRGRFPSESLSEPECIEMPPAISQTVSSPSFAKQIPVVKATVKKGRFKCQYCSELFEERSQCLVHISQKHGEERPHHCPLCDATFKKRRSLLYHVRHHNGERPYKCTYCDKAFKEKYHLTVHIRTHTGERPFACNQCGKAFKQTNELTSHIRTHTGEKPYKCNMCDKWFKRRTQLYNHNLSHIPNSALALQENSIDMDSCAEEEKPLEVLPLDSSME